MNVCHDLSCFLRDGEAHITELRRRYQRRRRRRARRGVVPRPLRCRPCGRGQRTARAVGRRTAARRGRARAGDVGEAAAKTRTEPWPNDPYPAGSGVAERYASLRALLAGDLHADDIVATIKDSGLRGMGGAGFPTGQKWAVVRDTQPGSVKYAICNADESEPGTFKDRQILATQPHLVLEGLLIGMAVIGAEQGWVFIRHEYGPEEHVLRAEIDAAARRRGHRPERVRQRATARRRCFRLAGWLHPR